MAMQLGQSTITTCAAPHRLKGQSQVDPGEEGDEKDARIHTGAVSILTDTPFPRYTFSIRKVAWREHPSSVES
jgi:hypothetical protein